MNSPCTIEHKCGLYVAMVRYGESKNELNELAKILIEKNSFVLGVYSGEITLADVPEAWQEEIQRRVDERIAAEGEAAAQDISAEEALDIILGGGGV